MAVIGPSLSGHLHTQLTRSLERILDEANQSGELKLSNRKLKEFPKAGAKYNLSDTVIAGRSTPFSVITPVCFTIDKDAAPISGRVLLCNIQELICFLMICAIFISFWGGVRRFRRG